MIKSILIALVLTSYLILPSLGEEEEGSPRKQRHDFVASLSFQTDGAPYSKIEALHYADLAGDEKVKACTHIVTGNYLTVPEGQGVEDNVLWIHELLEITSQQLYLCDLVPNFIDDNSKRLISSALEGGDPIKVFRECRKTPGEWCLNNEIDDFVFNMLEAVSKTTFGLFYDPREVSKLSRSVAKDLKTLLSLITLECRILEGGEKSVGCVMELSVPPQTIESMKPTMKKLLVGAQEFASEFKAYLRFALPLSWVRGSEEEGQEEPISFVNEEVKEDKETIKFVKVEFECEEDKAPVTFVNGQIVEDFLFMGEPIPAVIDLRNLEDFTLVKFTEDKRDDEPSTARKAFTVTVFSYGGGGRPYKDVYPEALDKTTSASLKKYLSIDPQRRGKSKLTQSDLAELKPEFFNNQDVMHLHSRALLSKLIAWSNREDDLYSYSAVYPPADKEHYLVNRLRAIHGITKVQLHRDNPYEITLEKSKLFNWEDLLERVNSVLLPHLQLVGTRPSTTESER